MVSVLGMIVRMFVYVAVIGGSSAVLYGIVTSQKKVYSDAYKGSCLLFGKAEKQDHSYNYVRLYAGASGWCKFVEFASASQLVLAVVMAIITVIRLTRRGSDGNRPSFSSVVEVFFVIPAFIIAVAGASITSAGLGLFCSRFRSALQDEDHSLSCSKFFIYTKSQHNYYFFKDLNTAQIGMWVTCAWLFHVILSMFVTRRWMRKSQNRGGLTESNAFTSTEKYRKMKEPSSL